jgi:hypothetical protein
MAEPAPKRAKTDVMAEVRVALRAASRAEWIGNIYEIKYLEQQAETIRWEESPIDKDTELGLIITQLEQKAARDRQKAANNTNKFETFTCCICMDRLPLGHLCVNVPCGHGFCKACIAKSAKTFVPPGEAAPPPTPECFTCRGNVASVLQTFV